MYSNTHYPAGTPRNPGPLRTLHMKYMTLSSHQPKVGEYPKRGFQEFSRWWESLDCNDQSRNAIRINTDYEQLVRVEAGKGMDTLRQLVQQPSER